MGVTYVHIPERLLLCRLNSTENIFRNWLLAVRQPSLLLGWWCGNLSHQKDWYINTCVLINTTLVVV